MARRRASRRAQRGIALLGLLAVAVMVFAYVLTSRLNAASKFVGIDRDTNAQVLSQAKRALIGWMAINAATDNNPGRLPCPQAWGDVGTTNEGRAAGNCSVPAVGWLPWRTLGLDRPLDASGNQIWYVISPGWHLPSAGATLSINSDSTGQLTLDGQTAVALVVAPGAALAIAPNANQIAAGCAARSQSQVLALPGTPPNPLDFLECQNGSTADNVFAASVVDNAVNQVFNDQVLAITAADIMPALEAAIADRMQREIAPELKAAAYTSAQYAGIPAGDFLYPYPVPFTNPSTSGYLGVAGSSTPQGLLPFNQINGACSAPPPCTTLPVTGSVRVVTGGGYGGYLVSSSCSASATEYLCTGKYHEDTTDPTRDVRIEMTATFSNVAMGLRTRSASPLSETLVEARDDGASPPPWITPSPTLQEVRMNDGAAALPDGTTPPRGSATIRFRAVLPNIDDNGWVTTADFQVRIQRAVIGDHFLLNADPNPVSNPLGAATSWFVRNGWYRSTFYAVAQANTADWLPSLGCNNTNCLRFNEGLGCGGGASWCNIRALLVLGGASLSNPAGRPNGNLSDYFEYQNGNGGTFYEQHAIRRPTNIAMANGPWNDRVILVDWPPSLPPLLTGTHPQVVSVSPLRTYTLP